MLQSQLNVLDSEIFGREQVNDPTGNLKYERDSLQLALEALIQTFTTKYPNYYQLRYNFQSSTLGQVQLKLAAKDEAILEYFWGKDQVFSMLIDPNEIKIFSFCQSKLSEDYLKKLNASQRKPRKSFTNDEIEAEIIQPATWIYDSLVRQPIELLNQQAAEPIYLSIIPDGPLNHLSFEGLLTQVPPKPYFFNQFNYLLQDSQIVISYDYSVNRKMQQTSEEKLPAYRYTYNQFTPDYSQSIYGRIDGGRSKREELKQVMASEGSINFWDGMEGNRITRSLIQDKAPQSIINHFPMHGLANKSNPIESALVLDEDQLLTAEDVYGMNMPMELALLDGCETGVGEVLPGEGLLNMGRAWTYAGAQSVFMSKWNAVDEYTGTLIYLLMEGLAEGKRKDQAWKDARLKLLQEQPGKITPYEWAAITPTGNMRPITASNRRGYLYVIGGLAIFAFLFFWLRGLRKNRVRIS
ncbi:MAG: CHAT domain-containing protein [Bacteroidota bacterium]